MIGMNPRAQEVFCIVSDLPPEARDAELLRLCGDDAALIGEVRSLLGFHDQTDAAADFLDASGLRATLTELAGGRLKAGTVVGEYTIVDFVGAGGMGDVYSARQRKPSRLVALKIVRPGLASERMVRLFSREAEILGLLSHPGIAQVFEAGVADYGLGPQPFLSMELVKGSTVIAFIEEQKRDVPGLCELVARMCDAVQHAHQRGVIHRDLKPGNIVITKSPDPTDSLGWQPKVLDFGIARTLDPIADGHTTMHTSPGLLAGTLAYMSPEQVEGNAATLDTRTDVYSLGVILFRAITGQMPRDIEGVSLPEAIRRISEAVPTKLSEIDRAFRGDLEAIVSTALEPDRTRRYQSAADFAADLRRYLSGRPILARQESAVSAISRRMTRYRHLITAGAVAVVLMASLAVFAFAKARESSRTAVVLAEALRETEQQRELARDSASSLRGELRLADIRRARMLAATGAMPAALAGMREMTDPEPDLLWTWAARDIVARGRCLATLETSDTIRAVALSPDGRYGAVAMLGGKVEIFNARDATSIGTFPIQAAAINGIASASDDKFCVVGDDGMIRLVRFADGVVLAEQRVGTRLTGVDASRMGFFAVAGPDATCLVDSETLQVVNQFLIPRQISHSVRVSDGQQAVAFGCRSGRVFVFDLARSVPLTDYQAHTDVPLTVEFLDNPPRMVSGSAQRTMVIADLRSGRITDRRQLNNGNLTMLRATSDGTLLAAGGWWRVDILRTDTLEPAMKAIATGTESGGFAASGDLLATGARTTTRLWSTSPIGESVAAHHPGQASDVVTQTKGTVIVSGWADGTVIVSDLRNSQEIRRWKVPGVVRGLALTPDESRCLVACENGLLYVGTIETGTLDALLGHTSRVACVDVDASGTFAYTGSRDQTVRRWNLEAMTPAGVTASDFGEVLGIRLSPDGATLAAIGRTRRMSFLDPHTLAIRQEVTTPFTLWDGDFSPDSKQFVAGSWGPSIEQFDVVRGVSTRSIRGHTQLVPDARFSPDGSLLLSASLDRSLKVWNAADGTELASFDLDAEAYHVAWIDGGFVASLGNGEIRRWNLAELDLATQRTILDVPTGPSTLR